MANADDDNVSILIGSGDGSFAGHVDFATGRAPSAVVARDFNGDGLLDLAVSNSGDGTVSILLGNGDGSFQTRVDYAAGPGAAGMAADDFNDDGKLDLAVANANTPITFRDQGLVSILLGNRDGTFQKHLDTRTQSLKPLDVATGDFNHDGKRDLAVVTRLDVFGSASILTGNGDGTFQIVHTYQVGRFSTQLATGDFNGDGEADLAVANFGSNTMTLLKGRGDGTFQNQGRYGTGAGPVGLVMDDFNGDNSLDAAVVNLVSNTVSVFVSRLGAALVGARHR